MKTLNIIVYPPGYAGNFLQLLLSLDPSTYPWIEGSSDRKTQYSFKFLQDNQSIWISHHLQFDWALYKFIQPFNRKFNHLVISIHPNNYYESMLEKFNELDKEKFSINYLSVDISEEAKQEHIEKFRERNGGFPHLRENELCNYDRYVQEFNPFKINLDMIFSSENDFLYEYERTCNHLNLSPQLDIALEFYREWRAARLIDRTTIYEPNEIINKTVELLRDFAIKNSLESKLPGLFKDGARGRI